MRDWLADPAHRPVLAGIGVGGAALAFGFVTQHWLGWLLIGALILLGLWGFKVVLGRIRQERQELLGRGLETPDAGPAEVSQGPSPLDERFADALRELRTQLGGRRGVYALPWFAVLGEPGAGKTALLQECGLDLPAQYARRASGATESCDFLLSNQAIALDTTGRWFRCSSERDARDWRRFLALLRRHRQHCPLDGVLVALPVPVLLGRGATELEEQARDLRRRLNELRVDLGVDAPVYLVLTKADALDGFVETVRHLPRAWVTQALGWTNDQRRLPDPEGRVESELAALAGRLDGFVPELLLRETDRTRQRRILGLPRELEVLGRAVAHFAGVAFKRDVYGEQMPFLRGVYLTSARVEGAAMSNALRRLGLAWADARRVEESWSALFLRDLVLDVICGDEGLALPDSRIGPFGRRAVTAAAGLAGLAIASVWSLSFAQNYRGTRELARLAQPATLADPGLADLSELWRAIAGEMSSASSPVQWLGFNRLERGTERGRVTYCSAFAKSFDALARASLKDALQGQDEDAVRAAIELARDIDFVATQGADLGKIPDWTAYLPPSAKDPKAYHAAYAAYVRWLSERERRELLRESQETLSRVAPRVVQLPVLESISERPGGSLPPQRYADLGLENPASPRASSVAGIYTPAGDQLIEQLLGAIERTDSMTGDEIAQFRGRYAERYESSWRQFFLGTPVRPRAAADVKASPYLALLHKVDENTAVERLAQPERPGWVTLLHGVLGTSVPLLDTAKARVQGDEKPVAPWPEYQKALEAVAAQTEDGTGDGEKALLVAQDAAVGKPTAYSSALELVVRLLPRDSDAEARAKLRELLEAPILDGFSAVLERARGELDRSWKDKIGRPYAGELAPERLAELYDPGAGALAQFLTKDLGPFFRDGRPRALLGNRGLVVRDSVIEWIAWAQGNARLLPLPGAAAVGRSLRVRGVPSVVESKGRSAGGALNVTRVDLRFVCPEGDQTFIYKQGNGEDTLKWNPGCEEIALRVLVAGSTLESQQELPRSWSGPRAFQNFLRDGRAIEGRVHAWNVEGPEGIVVRVKYDILAGGGTPAAEARHRPPPPALGG